MLPCEERKLSRIYCPFADLVFLKGQTKNNPCKGKNKCGASENPMLRFLCGNSLLSSYLFAERCLNISKDIAAAAPAAESELRNAFP